MQIPAPETATPPEEVPLLVEPVSATDTSPLEAVPQTSPHVEDSEGGDFEDEGDFEDDAPPRSRSRVVASWVLSGFAAGSALGALALGAVFLHREFKGETPPAATASIASVNEAPRAPQTAVPVAVAGDAGVPARGESAPGESVPGESVPVEVAASEGADAAVMVSGDASAALVVALAQKPETATFDEATDYETEVATPPSAQRSSPWSGMTVGNGRTLYQAGVSVGLDTRTAVLVGQALGAQHVDVRNLKATDRIAFHRETGRVLFQRTGESAWHLHRNAHGVLEADHWSGALPTIAWRDASVELGPSGAPLRITQAGAVTGYVDGHSISLRVVMLEATAVEEHTAQAYNRLHEAALHDGVTVRIVSGFRTMEHQQQLYAAYRAGRGNLAAKPGHSNHQSGRALDLNTASPGVYRWMQHNAQRFGFRRTVPTEPWHWEYIP